MDAMAAHVEVVSLDDDAGNQHDLTVLFEMTSTDEWMYYAIVDAGELADPGSIGYADGYAFSIPRESLFRWKRCLAIELSNQLLSCNHLVL